MRIANATSRDRDKDAQVREALRDYPVLCWSWVPGCIFTRRQQERVVDYIQVEQVGRWVMSGQWKRGKVFQPLLLYSSNFSSSSPSSRHVYKLGSVPTSTCLSTLPTYPPTSCSSSEANSIIRRGEFFDRFDYDRWLGLGLACPPFPPPHHRAQTASLQRLPGGIPMPRTW